MRARRYHSLASCPPCFYKKRVGNFYVCCSSRDKKSDGVEKIYCLVPMCWPMLCFTYSLISAITLPLLYFTLQHVHPVWMAVELVSTVTLYTALALTSFRDFGVFPRCVVRSWTLSLCVFSRTAYILHSRYW